MRVTVMLNYDPLRSVRFDGHQHQRFNELLALAYEQPIRNEAIDGSYSSAESVGERTNDRDMGKVGVDELARDGENQARLNLRIQWTEEVGECQAGFAVRKRRHRGLHAVAREIDPFQEVGDLVSTNAKCDLKHLGVAYLLAHDGVKTRSALLNVSKVKGGHIRDRLKMIAIGIVQLSSRPWNGGDVLQSDRLREGGAEIRVRCTAVTNVPAGVDGKIHEVGEAFYSG